MSEACKGINKGPKSEETRRKISETLKGNIPWNKGVPMTEEQRLKQIEIKREMYSGEKGEIIKQKIREANLGLYYWNDGKIEIKSKECPGENFIRGRIKKCEKQQGLLRWNNGIINVYSRECPGEGFVRGMLKK